jgi:KaiC/GvpD/RAD55 family RecA-like ATPase
VSFPVEVPGLDTIIPEIEDGRLLVVESGADSAKSYFVRRLSLSAGRVGIPVTFVTSRDEIEVRSLLASEGEPDPPADGWIRILERDGIDSFEDLESTGTLLTVDSFSYLTLNLPPAELASSLRRLRTACRTKRMTAILATDRGMLDSRSEAVVTHLSDGYLQFHAREGPEGVLRFLRIPKWMDGKFVDRNIYYEFDGKRIAIDLRRRVL